MMNILLKNQYIVGFVLVVGMNINAAAVIVSQPSSTSVVQQPVAIAIGSKIATVQSSSKPIAIKQTTTQAATPSAVAVQAVKLDVQALTKLAAQPDFIKAQKTLFMTQQLMDQLFAKYRDFKNRISKSSATPTPIAIKSSDSAGQQTGALNRTIIKESFDYQKQYQIFMQNIASSDTSYLAVMKGMMNAYQTLYKSYQADLEKSGTKLGPDAQTTFVKAQFQTGSPILGIVAEIYNALIAFLTARCAVIDADYYAENSMAYDLFGDGTAQGASQYADAIVAQISGVLEEQFKVLDGDKNLQTAEREALRANYQSLITAYAQKKNLLIAQTVMRLLEQLAARNSVASLNFLTRQQPVNDLAIEKYATAFQEACALLAQLEDGQQNYASRIQSSCTSLQQVVAQASHWIASLYAFNYGILSKSLERSVMAGQVDEQEIFQALDLMSTSISGAASNSTQAGDTVMAQNYYVQMTLLQTLLSSWVNGNKAYASSSYGTALKGLSTSYDCANKLGFSHTAAVLLTKIQTLNLEYEKSLFQLYVTNETYGTTLGSYIKNACLPATASYESDQAAWCSIWHPAAFTNANASKNLQQSDFYKGFYTFASNALQTLTSVISTIGKNQFTVSGTVAADITLAKKSLDNLVFALHEMLVQGTLFADKQPADNNLYVNYYTPTAYREAFVQYQVIIQKIDAIDRMFSTAVRGKTNEYFPLYQFISTQKAIKNLGMLFRLHYARWAYSMGMYSYGYATSSACLTDKVCVVYKNACLQFALCALGDAQRLYRSLGLSSLVSAIQSKLQELKPSAGDLVVFAKGLQDAWSKQQNAPVNQLYDILFYYQIAALVDPEQYGTVYVAALENLETQEANASLKHDFGQVYAAYLAYRGYLWATYTKNIAAKSTYQSRLKERCAAAVQAITAVQTAQKNTTDPAQSIVYGQQLQRLDDIVTMMQSGQEFDRTALQVTESPLVVVQEIVAKDRLITTKKVTLWDGSGVVLDNVAYSLARSYLQQADQEMAKLQKAFTARQFDMISQDAFTSIFTKYMNVCQIYSDLGMSTEFAAATAKVSAAVAFNYYSLVLPTDQITNRIKTLAPKSNTAIEGTSQAAIDISKPFYLLRIWQHNLTDAFALVDQNIRIAQEQSDTKTVEILNPSRDAYRQILAAATALIGSTDVEAIITKVVVPLYRERAVRAGYQEVISSLESRVNAYQKQLLELAKNGTTVAGITYKTQIAVVNQKQDDGTESILLNCSYLPLSPFPEFTGDISALTLYVQYQQFFAPAQDAIQTDLGSFVAIPNVALFKQVQTLVNQTYYAAVLVYEEVIEQLKNTLKVDKNFSKSAFALYKSHYARLQELHLQIFALYDVLDQGQRDSGVTTFDVQKLYGKKFQDYADCMALFMIGNPLASEYVTIVNGAAMNVLIALNYLADTTQQAKLYTKAGDIYKKAGDACCAAAVVPPSINGYPNPAPTGYLTTRLTVPLPSTLTCAQQPTYKIPIGASITFHGFAQAYGYYQQALKQYRAAYALTNKNSALGEMNDQNVRTAWVLQAYAALQYGMQRIALFGRNAFDEIKNKTVGIPSFECAISTSLQALISDASNSAGAVTGSISSLMGVGTGNDSSAYLQQRFACMKKLILEGLIYVTATLNIISDATKSIGKASDSTTAKTYYGSALVCAANALFPALGATVENQQMLFVQAFSKSPSNGDLVVYLSQEQQYGLLHADGFAQLTDYMFAALAGTASDGYVKFKDPANIAALNTFVTQMYGVLRTVYGQVFLSDLAASSDPASVTNLQMSINSAISSAQQAMLVDSSGYVG